MRSVCMGIWLFLWTQPTHPAHKLLLTVTHSMGWSRCGCFPVSPFLPRDELKVQRGVDTGSMTSRRSGIHSPFHHPPCWLVGLRDGDHMRAVQTHMSQLVWLTRTQELSGCGPCIINSLPLLQGYQIRPPTRKETEENWC